MSEDHTLPMDQPEWSRRETNLDDQETMYADQNSVTPPTLPVEDHGGWQRSPMPDTGPGRSPGGAPPPSYPPSQPPYTPPPPGVQPPPGLEPQTMMISERPTPVFAWLVVLDGPDRNTIGTVHTLHPDTTTLGRVQGNQIVLRDETVSAQHARIRREVKEGQNPVFAIFDLGSRNGIYAGNKENYRDDEKRVYRHELGDGDYLLLGETTLVFKEI